MHVATQMFGWAFVIFIDAPFALFAYKWYTKNRTRGRLLFFWGWVLATSWGVFNNTIVPMYIWPTFPQSGPKISPEALAYASAVEGFLRGAGSIPLLLAGIGFLIVALAEIREGRRTMAN